MVAPSSVIMTTSDSVAIAPAGIVPVSVAARYAVVLSLADNLMVCPDGKVRLRALNWTG
jgi:hypothetical protein